MSTMPMEQLSLKLKLISSQERFRYYVLTSFTTVERGGHFDRFNFCVMEVVCFPSTV